jgi:hypothetical protein
MRVHIILTDRVCVSGIPGKDKERPRTTSGVNVSRIGVLEEQENRRHQRIKVEDCVKTCVLQPNAAQLFRKTAKHASLIISMAQEYGFRLQLGGIGYSVAPKPFHIASVCDLPLSTIHTR